MFLGYFLKLLNAGAVSFLKFQRNVSNLLLKYANYIKLIETYQLNKISRNF